MQDLLLAILVDKEHIKLAPSSSQIPALLAKTKQNIFDVRAQQQAAQRYQQRFQPRPSSAGGTPRDVVMGAASRRDSQVSLPGPPALLPTASGINLAAEVDQVSGGTAPGNVCPTAHTQLRSGSEPAFGVCAMLLSVNALSV